MVSSKIRTSEANTYLIVRQLCTLIPKMASTKNICIVKKLVGNIFSCLNKSLGKYRFYFTFHISLLLREISELVYNLAPNVLLFFSPLQIFFEWAKYVPNLYSLSQLVCDLFVLNHFGIVFYYYLVTIISCDLPLAMTTFAIVIFIGCFM